jgi:branched-chain amino acid transport system ATP-binding protein
MSDNQGTVIIETKGLSVGYGGRAVLSNLDITVRSGQVVSLIGRNGVGKTTTLMTLAGLIPPVSGEVSLWQKPAAGPLQARAKNGMAYISEERSIIRHLTVLDNLKLGGAKASEVYELFPELASRGKRMAGLLSGGEQQMLALGRCLATSANMYLIDELSLGLGPSVVKRLLTQVRAAADAGAAVLLVEQKPSLALSISDEGYILSQGSVSIHDDASSLLQRLPEIERSYLALGELADVKDE